MSTSRRGTRRLAAVAVLALAGGAVSAAEELQGWTHYMANAARTGGAATKGLDVQPKVRWTFPALDKTGGNVVVAEGLVYMVNGKKLLAIDVATGKEKWSAGCEQECTPTLAEAVAVVVTPKGLAAFDRRTGQPAWTHDAGGPASEPAITGGVMYFIAADKVQAVKLADRSPVWTHAVRIDPKSAHPCAAGEGAVAFTAGGKLHVLDLATGKPRFTGEIPEGSRPGEKTVGYWGAPSIGEGKVFTKTDTACAAFDLAGGKRLWQVNTCHHTRGCMPTYLNGKACLGGKGGAPKLIDVTTGKVVLDAGKVAKEAALKPKGQYATAPHPLIGGSLYYCLVYGLPSISAIDIEGGKLKWFYECQAGYCSPGCVVWDGLVFMRSYRHGLVCLEAGEPAGPAAEAR